MKQNNTPQEIYSFLQNKKNVLMSLHPSPDGDSLGSSCAMKYFLETHFGSRVTLISKDEISHSLQRIPYCSEVQFDVSFDAFNFHEYDAIVFLDNADLHRFGFSDTFFDSCREKILNIDHHATNDRFGALNFVIDDSPSACSVFLSLLKIWSVSIDAKLAQRLLLGVCTDSGFFRNVMDQKTVLKDATFLLDCGANYTDEILRPVIYGQSFSLKKLQGEVLHNLLVENNYAYSIVSHNAIADLHLSESDLRLGIGVIQDLEHVDFVFLLIETNDGIKGSFRSVGRFDVSIYAKSLGGGGHKPAAGFTLSNMSLQDALTRTKKVIEENGKIPF